MSDDSRTPDEIDYVELTRKAHMAIVREALKSAKADGLLPGQHHFYISFRTRHEGIRLSDTLSKRFPQEMTIVIQNQFWDLRVNEDAFEIVLKFGGVPEQLRVPFEAITHFVDPGVEFSLIFIPPPDSNDSEQADPETETASNEDISDSSGEVVSLAAFRDRE